MFTLPQMVVLPVQGVLPVRRSFPGSGLAYCAVPRRVLNLVDLAVLRDGVIRLDCVPVILLDAARSLRLRHALVALVYPIGRAGTLNRGTLGKDAFRLGMRKVGTVGEAAWASATEVCET